MREDWRRQEVREDWRTQRVREDWRKQFQVRTQGKHSPLTTRSN